ncbi:MAG: hypothetical protein B6U76_02670 [Desulfurococcales archaeon ex4484_217_2]|nr:MAG: hypothetical protein B6U76_02670 [Desulfurococcales archaeon ex4484_217_2]
MQTLILPIGSYEYHWSLPLNTDTLIALCVSRKLAEKLEKVIIYPPVNYSVSIEHLECMETISVDPEVFLAYMRNIVLNLLKLKPERIVLINGHGGNKGLLTTLITELQYTASEIDIVLLDIWSAIEKIASKYFGIKVGNIVHGGLIEASIIAACGVKLKEFKDITLEEAIKIIAKKSNNKSLIKRPWSIKDLKEPTKIYSKELGERLLEVLVSEVVREIRHHKKGKIEPL